MNRNFYVWLITGICLVHTDPAGSEETEPLPWVRGNTTLVVMPDTERYSDDYPRLFEVQTHWIRENWRRRKIAYVLHLGDITQHNAPAEWELAKRCFGILDGQVPYALVPGNHDYSGPSRSTLINRFFSVAEMQKWPTFGGAYQQGRLENSYHSLPEI